MRLKAFSNRSFGCEFEIGNEVPAEVIVKYLEGVSTRSTKYCQNPNGTPKWDESINNDYWHVKYDSTCGITGGGLEVASFKANGWDDLNHIADTANGLEYFGCRVNDNCGFHIHAEVADFTPTQMGILLGRWVKIEPMLCKLVPPRRVNNYFCRLLCKSRKLALSKSHSAESIFNAYKQTNFNPHENRQKKVTLNVLNYAANVYYEALQSNFGKPKTIEFRLPEGTTSYGDVIGWTVFFLNFIESAKEATAPPENLLGVKSLRKFFQLSGMGADKDCMLDDILLTTKLWLLKRFYMFGSDELKNQIGRLQFD